MSDDDPPDNLLGESREFWLWVVPTVGLLLVVRWLWG